MCFSFAGYENEKQNESSAAGGGPAEPIMNHPCLKRTYWTDGGQQMVMEMETERKRRKTERGTVR